VVVQDVSVRKISSLVENLYDLKRLQHTKIIAEFL